jgi:catechol 2,3-dioxygenase-like lactoylglutathione lyase family enzyme
VTAVIEVPTVGHVQGVSHISIQVRDIDTSLRFYRDMLGLEVSVDLQHETERDIDGVRTKVTRRVAFLRWQHYGGAPYLVLGQIIDRGPIGAAAQLGQLGIDHIAFRVDDADVVLAKAIEMGYEIVKPIADQPAIQYGHRGDGTARVVMLRDPDGTLVQVDHWR